MKKKINNFFEDPTPNVYRCTIKNKVNIIDTDRGCFVFKEKKGNNIDNIYNYLKSRSFDYYPKLLKTNDTYNIYEYIENIDTPNEQKALDMIYILSMLHNKTTFYKEVDSDEYKIIYENLLYEIESINNYYNNVIEDIEKTIYMSPSQYLIARNISQIYLSLYYSRTELDKWYEQIKEKNKKRVVTLYNNLDIDHLIRNKDLYLVGWEKSKIDIPIYDFCNFYKKYALDFEFFDLLKEYENRYPLLADEKKLLFILINIPERMIFTNDEFENCKKAKNIVDYIYKTEKLIFSEKENNTKNEGNDFNK